MKKLINCFFKGIFATVMIAITGQLYWNFYIVEKFGIGKVVEDSSVFIIGAAVLYSIFALLTGRKDEEVYEKFDWIELICLFIGNIYLIYIYSNKIIKEGGDNFLFLFLKSLINVNNKNINNNEE